MKTLICLSSQIKDSVADYCFDSLIKHVITKLPEKPDIIGHFSSPESHKIDRFKNISDGCLFRWEDDPELTDEQLSWNKYMAPQVNGIRGNLLQWLSMKNCGHMKREKEKSQGPYDLVIQMRPDLLFINDIENDLAVPSDTLFVSPHDGWGGYNDRFSYGHSKLMDQRMDIYDYFTDHWYPGVLRHPGSIKRGERTDWNPELVYSTYIRNHLKAAVCKTKITFLRLKEYQGEVYVMLPLREGIMSEEFDPSTFDGNRYGKLLSVLFQALKHPSVRSVPPYERKRFISLDIFKPFQEKINAL